MRIQPRDLTAIAKGPVETRFSKVIGQYDDYINHLLRNIRSWQIVGGLSVIMLVCTVIGWFKILAEQKRESVIVIEVNELNRARFLGRATSGNYLKGFEVKDYMIEGVLTEWIEDTRSIYVDADVMNRNILKAVNFMSGEMKEKLRLELEENNPFNQVGRIKQFVLIENMIRVTRDTWQFDWWDIFTDVTGRELRRIRMMGMFTIARQEPRNDTERKNNPLGIYIVDYNIKQVNEVLR